MCAILSFPTILTQQKYCFLVEIILYINNELWLLIDLNYQKKILRMFTNAFVH